MKMMMAMATISMQQLNSERYCGGSCNNDIMRLREIVLATMMSTGLSLLQWQCCESWRDCACNVDVNRLIALARTKLQGSERSSFWQQCCKAYRFCDNNVARIKRLRLQRRCHEAWRDCARDNDGARLIANTTWKIQPQWSAMTIQQNLQGAE